MLLIMIMGTPPIYVVDVSEPLPPPRNDVPDWLPGLPGQGEVNNIWPGELWQLELSPGLRIN